MASNEIARCECDTIFNKVWYYGRLLIMYCPNCNPLYDDDLPGTLIGEGGNLQYFLRDPPNKDKTEYVYCTYEDMCNDVQ